MSVTVTVAMSQMERIRDQFPKLLDDYTRAIGNALRKRIPELIESELGRYQTGQLASTVRTYVSMDGVTVQIGPTADKVTGADYTGFVFGGVKKHMMDQAAKGRTWPMQWSHAGGSGVSMAHEHPGQRARTDILEAIRALVLQVALEEFVLFKLLGAT